MTLSAHWVRGWLERPDDVVLVDGGDGWTLPGAAIEAATRDLAGRIAAAGVGAGDRVLLSRAPSVETVLAYVAVLRLGAVVVPANTAYTARELAHIVGDVRPVLALVDDAARIDGVPAYGGRLDDLPPAVAATLDASADDDLAMVAYTSGTTGAPKGAMLSHGNLRAGADALVQTWGWTRSDRLLHTLPLFHMHGLGAGLNGSFTAGASVVLSRFEPALVVETASAYGATLYFGVPTMYAKLAEAGRLTGLRGLRLLVSGSAPLDPVLFAQIAAEAGQPPVERYGMTETVMLTSNALDDRVPGSRGAGAARSGGAARGRGSRRGQGPQRVSRVLGATRGDGRGLHRRRLLPHGRHRHGRRRRPPAPRRSRERAHHHRRLQRLPARGRGRPARARVRRRRRGDRRPRRDLGRDGRGVRGAC